MKLKITFEDGRIWNLENISAFYPQPNDTTKKNFMVVASQGVSLVTNVKEFHISHTESDWDTIQNSGLD